MLAKSFEVKDDDDDDDHNGGASGQALNDIVRSLLARVGGTQREQSDQSEKLSAMERELISLRDTRRRTEEAY